MDLHAIEYLVGGLEAAQNIKLGVNLLTQSRAC